MARLENYDTSTELLGINYNYPKISTTTFRFGSLHTCPGVIGPETTIFDPNNRLETAKNGTKRWENNAIATQISKSKTPSPTNQPPPTCGMEATDLEGRVREWSYIRGETETLDREKREDRGERNGDLKGTKSLLEEERKCRRARLFLSQYAFAAVGCCCCCCCWRWMMRLRIARWLRLKLKFVRERKKKKPWKWRLWILIFFVFVNRDLLVMLVVLNAKC